MEAFITLTEQYKNTLRNPITFDEVIRKLKRNYVINSQSDLTKNEIYAITGWCNRHNIRTYEEKLNKYNTGKTTLRVFVRCFVYNS